MCYLVPQFFRVQVFGSICFNCQKTFANFAAVRRFVAPVALQATIHSELLNFGFDLSDLQKLFRGQFQNPVGQFHRLNFSRPNAGIVSLAFRKTDRRQTLTGNPPFLRCLESRFACWPSFVQFQRSGWFLRRAVRLYWQP